MPSVVRIERGRAIALWDQPGLVIVEDDQAAGGGLQLLDQSTVTRARWVDEQGSCGVHGVSRSVVECEPNINHWLLNVKSSRCLVCDGTCVCRFDRVIF